MSDTQWSQTEGMSLRDHFAGLAMQGFAADPSCTWHGGLAGMAEQACLWADAMLAEREKQ